MLHSFVRHQSPGFTSANGSAAGISHLLAVWPHQTFSSHPITFLGWKQALKTKLVTKHIAAFICTTIGYEIRIVCIVFRRTSAMRFSWHSSRCLSDSRHRYLLAQRSVSRPRLITLCLVLWFGWASEVQTSSMSKRRYFLVYKEARPGIYSSLSCPLSRSRRVAVEVRSMALLPSVWLQEYEDWFVSFTPSWESHHHVKVIDSAPPNDTCWLSVFEDSSLFTDSLSSPMRCK